MELDLSEGRSTGIPTIQEELRNNGSPKNRGRTEIANIFDISVTAAGNLITKMKETGIISDVKGLGKGKYKFVVDFMIER